MKTTDRRFTVVFFPCSTTERVTHLIPTTERDSPFSLGLKYEEQFPGHGRARRREQRRSRMIYRIAKRAIPFIRAVVPFVRTNFLEADT